jgi:hypothetical protein
VIDIIVPHWLTEPEQAEAASVAAEMQNQRIATETGEKCLPTASLNWEAVFVSGSPPGAMTTVNARETLTRAANRRRWDRQKRLRSGGPGLLNAIRAA